MNLEIMQILRNYSSLVEDILESKIEVRIGNGKVREATEKDKLELLREEWFQVVEEIGE